MLAVDYCYRHDYITEWFKWNRKLIFAQHKTNNDYANDWQKQRIFN